MERCRVHERDAGAVRARPRRRSGQLQPGADDLCDCGVEVGDPKGQVMDALAPTVEKPGKRPLSRQRLDQLDLRRPDRDERYRGPFAGHGRPIPGAETQGRERNDGLCLEIPDDDRQMGEARSGAHTTADGR